MLCVPRESGDKVELNVQIDHLHLFVKISPKLPVSNVMGHLNVVVNKNWPRL
ncbi:transposase [Pantoea sp.]|uniref:transposase n=1 Tax=Pantoea sp. TaxID=69393 RepID=UPI003977D89F